MPSTLYSCSLQVVSNERWSCHEERSSTCNPSMSIMMTNAQPPYCPIVGLPVMLATAGVIVGPLRTRPHPPIEMYTLDQTRWHTVTSPPADRLTTTHPLHDLTPRCYAASSPVSKCALVAVLYSRCSGQCCWPFTRDHRRTTDRVATPVLMATSFWHIGSTNTAPSACRSRRRIIAIHCISIAAPSN